MPKPSLQIQLNLKSLLMFLFLFFFMHELHELAHIITGRVICGCWGSRDFNVWRICEDCASNNRLTVLATFAGPIFTFTMLWLGRYWVKYGKSFQYNSLGLALIFGNMPFGRIYMAAMGSGDEVSGLRALFLTHDHSNTQIIRAITFLIVFIICIPPLVTAYKAIVNKKRILIYISFLIVPLILDTLIILILLNGILQKGVLNQVWIMGTPLLITIWFILCGLIIGINFRVLTHFAKASPKTS